MNVFTYLGGLKMCTIDGDQGMSSLIRLFGIHEPHATKATMKLLKPGMKVIDIGANLGYYAFIEARAVGDEGFVYAIEPAPDSYAHLEAGAKANEFKNIRTYPLAIGDSTGHAMMNIGMMSNSSNMLHLEDESLLSTWASDHLTNSMNGKVEVFQTTLDKFCKDNYIKQVDYLRMDTEGYEIQIMEGAWETVSDMGKGSIIFMETHPIFYQDRTPYAEMYDRLTSFGFIPHRADDNGDLTEVTKEEIVDIDVLHVFWINNG